MAECLAYTFEVRQVSVRILPRLLMERVVLYHGNGARLDLEVEVAQWR